MRKLEKVTLAYGVAGWFTVIHFTGLLFNRIITSLISTFISIRGGMGIDGILMKKVVLSMLMNIAPIALMILLGCALIYLYRRNIKRTNECSEDIRLWIFPTVGLLIVIMPLSTFIITIVYNVQALLMIGNLQDPTQVLVYFGFQCLINIIEGLLGAFLFLKFKREAKENIVADSQ